MGGVVVDSVNGSSLRHSPVNTTSHKKNVATRAAHSEGMTPNPMAQPWIKVVALDALDPAKSYFISLRHHDAHGRPHYTFYSSYLSGRTTWSTKPGIAIQYQGGDTLRNDILKNNHLDLVALEVPADADKRWKARKPVRRFR